MVINVYSQYFLAKACFSGVERRDEIDVIAAEHDAAVDWEHPLNEARMGF